MKKITAIKGELAIATGGRQLRLQAGEFFMVVPVDRLYRFYNPAESPVSQKKTDTGHKRFEHELAIAYGLAEDGKLNKKGIPKYLDHMALLMSLTHTDVPGFFSVDSTGNEMESRYSYEKRLTPGIDKALLPVIVLTLYISLIYSYPIFG